MRLFRVYTGLDIGEKGWVVFLADHFVPKEFGVLVGENIVERGRGVQIKPERVTGGSGGLGGGKGKSELGGIGVYRKNPLKRKSRGVVEEFS